MSRHTRPGVRWTAVVREQPENAGSLLAVKIEYAGRPFADIYATHADGPGLQIVSGRLDFAKGVVGVPGKGPQPWIALGVGDFAELPTGPLPWLALKARP